MCIWGTHLLKLLKKSGTPIAKVRFEWKKLLPLLTVTELSLLRKGRLHTSCVRSAMLYGSKTMVVKPGVLKMMMSIGWSTLKRAW